MGAKIEIGDEKTVVMGCPQCASADLWQGVSVPGWRGIKAERREVDDFKMIVCEPHGDHEVEWREAENSGEFGCGECGWEGRLGDLVQLQQDGQPLPGVSPGQQSLIDEPGVVSDGC